MGIPADAWGYGFIFIENAQAPNVSYGCGDADILNYNWGVTPGGPYSNVAMDWGITAPSRQEYMPRSPENLRIAARRVCDDFRRLRRRKLERRRSRSCNPIVNLRVNCRVDDREGPATKYIFVANLHC